MDFYLGIDIGGTKIAIGLVDKSGIVIDFFKIPTDKQKSYKNTINEIIKIYVEITKKISKSSKIKAIGIACPGPVDSKNGIIVNPANLLSWSGANIAEDIYKKTGVTSFLEHDISAAALAENWIGIGKDYEDMVYITFSTGISAGIINNRQLINGAFGSAGEFGHMIIKPDGPKCHCGSYGCLEELACGRTFFKRAKNIKCNYESYGTAYLFSRYIQIINYKIEDFQENFGKSGSIQKDFHNLEISIIKGDLAFLINNGRNISAKEIGDLAEKGDAFAKFVYWESAFFLGIGIVNLISLIDPQAIILGGGLTKSWDVYYPVLYSTIRSFLKQVPIERYRILKAKLGDQVGVIGAARAAMLNIKE